MMHVGRIRLFFIMVYTVLLHTKKMVMKKTHKIEIEHFEQHNRTKNHIHNANSTSF